MKIDILTFSNASNFGAVLQAFALQHYLKLLGHEVKHIDFTYTVKQKKSNVTTRENESFFVNFSTRLNGKIKRNRFAKFRSKYISFSEVHCTDLIPVNIDDCEAYIIGSDQIWNTDLNGENTAFYLDFVTKGKKIAYAASVGRNMTDNDRKYIMQYCSRLDSISVRENSLRNFFVHEFRLDVSVTIDPVFLLDKRKWRIIEKKAVTPSKYILCYLMEDSLGIRDAAVCLSKKMGAKIIWINGGSVKINEQKPFPGREIKRVGPQQFVYLIDHSVAVVTNSFHGAAFSLIFEKKLCLVEHSKRNERLTQLLEYIESRDKMILCNCPIQDITSAVIEESISKFKNIISSSEDFLQRSLLY